MGAHRRHKTLGPETKNFITHLIRSNKNISILYQVHNTVPTGHTLQWKPKYFITGSKHAVLWTRMKLSLSLKAVSRPAPGSRGKHWLCLQGPSLYKLLGKLVWNRAVSVSAHYMSTKVKGLWGTRMAPKNIHSSFYLLFYYYYYFNPDSRLFFKLTLRQREEGNDRSVASHMHPY